MTIILAIHYIIILNGILVLVMFGMNVFYIAIGNSNTYVVLFSVYNVVIYLTFVVLDGFSMLTLFYYVGKN